jgi:hypothetical protein
LVSRLTRQPVRSSGLPVRTSARPTWFPGIDLRPAWEVGLS